MKDHLHYSHLLDNAMRSVVREVLRSTMKTGLPGEHHFYISFRTQFPGVRISETLQARYPEEMTIVLQHQFWDFKVEDTEFQVTLSFSGTPEKLVIPFSALTAFADPSVKFGLQFQVPQLPAVVPPASDIMGEITVHEGEESGDANGAEIISLDAFRKK